MAIDTAKIAGIIIDAVSDEGALAELSESLANFGNGMSCLLQTHNGVASKAESAFGFDRAFNDLYIQHYWREDIWIQAYQALSLSEVASTDFLIPEDVMLKTTIYNEFLKKNGDMFRCLGFNADVGNNETLIFGLHRARTQPTFEDDIYKLIEIAQPYLIHLIKARGRLAEGRGAIAQRIVDTELDAVFVVTSTRVVRYMNHAAHCLLDINKLIALNDRRLSVATGLNPYNFNQAVAWACNGRGGSSVEAQADGERYNVSVDALAGNGKGLACIRIRNENNANRLCVDAGRIKFGFSRAEASLATSLMSGMSPTQHAAARGIGLPTVRTQLRSLFVKSSVTKQTELIHVLRALG